MRTLIVGEHIEIEGRTVGLILPGAMASHQDHLRHLVERDDGTDARDLERIEDGLTDMTTGLEGITDGLDDPHREETTPAEVLKAMKAVTDLVTRLTPHDNTALSDTFAAVGNLADSVSAWIEADVKARDRLAAEVETAAATGYTDEQARAKLPVVEAALAHANGRVTELTSRLCEVERDNETLRPMMKRLTAQAGSDNHAHLAEVEALRRQNETQAGEIRRLSEATNHARSELTKQHRAHADAVSKARAAGVAEGKAAAGSAGTVTAPVTPASPIGFDGAATRLYLHLQMQAHKLDPATKKLVLAVGKALG